MWVFLKWLPDVCIWQCYTSQHLSHPGNFRNAKRKMIGKLDQKTIRKLSTPKSNPPCTPSSCHLRTTTISLQSPLTLHREAVHIHFNHQPLSTGKPCTTQLLRQTTIIPWRTPANKAEAKLSYHHLPSTISSTHKSKPKKRSIDWTFLMIWVLLGSLQLICP